MAENKKKTYRGLQDMFNLQYCPMCKKDYIIPDTRTWAYKKTDGKRLIYFCSYGCKNRWMRQKELI